MQWWDAARMKLMVSAGQDLEVHGQVRPCLIAAQGEDVRLVARLRPFPPGGVEDPLIEVLALAGGLACDRLALSLAGRAWSLDDPIAPVAPGVGDLRARVLVIHLLDGAVEPVAVSSTVVPYAMQEGGVEFGEALEPGTGQGRLPRLLEVGATLAGKVPSDPFLVAEQAQRCLDLGHAIELTPSSVSRLPPGSVVPHPR